MGYWGMYNYRWHEAVFLGGLLRVGRGLSGSLCDKILRFVLVHGAFAGAIFQ